MNWLKTWIRAIRPFAFTGSVIPVILGAVYASKETKFLLGYFILSVLAIMLLHSGTNLVSDYDDYKNKVDVEGSYGGSGVLMEKILTPKQIKNGARNLLILGFLVGVFLSIERGWPILAIGLSGAYLGYNYTAKPLQLKYRGLGAPLIFLLFGPMMTIGSFYVQAQRISAASFFISIPVGLLTTAILHANDIRDVKYDKQAGIKTMSIIIGRSSANKVYYGLVYISYISILLMVIFGVLPVWSLVCFVTLPVAIKLTKKLTEDGDSVQPIIALDKATGQLHAQFGILLILSIILSLFI